MLPPSGRSSYLLTIFDRFTRWPDVYPISDISAETTAHAFLEGWVARFGMPVTITTDLGGQFESMLWSSLMKQLGIHHVRTTAYHPAANGMVERLHRQLKASLMANGPAAVWRQALPLVLLGLRTSVKADINCSAAELVYGEPLRLPGEFLSGTMYDPSISDTTAFGTALSAVMRQLRAVPPHDT